MIFTQGHYPLCLPWSKHTLLIKAPEVFVSCTHLVYVRGGHGPRPGSFWCHSHAFLQLGVLGFLLNFESWISCRMYAVGIAISFFWYTASCSLPEAYSTLNSSSVVERLPFKNRSCTRRPSRERSGGAAGAVPAAPRSCRVEPDPERAPRALQPAPPRRAPRRRPPRPSAPCTGLVVDGHRRRGRMRAASH